MASRIFIRSFCITSIALACLTLASPLIIDPYSLFNLVTIEGFNAHKTRSMLRDREQRAVAVCLKKPQSVVISSSTGAIGMNPTILSQSEVYGETYNLSSPSVAISEMRYLANHAIHGSGRLKRLVLGMDFLMFNAYKNFEKVDGTNFNSARLIPYGKRNCLEVYIAQHSMVTGLQAMYDSFKTVLGSNNVEYLTPLGQMAYISGDEKGVVSTVNPPYRAAKGYMELSWRSPPEYRYCMKTLTCENRMDEFRQLVRDAYVKNVAVDVFFSPLHVSMNDAMYEIGFYTQFEAWKRDITMILYEEAQRFNQPEPIVLDYTYPNTIKNYVSTTVDGEKPFEALFFNESHYGERVGNRVQEDLIAKHPTHRDFGMRLSPKTVDAALHEQRERLMRWRQTHPKSVAVIREYARVAYNQTRTIGCSPAFNTLAKADKIAKDSGPEAAITYLTQALAALPRGDVSLFTYASDGTPIGTSDPRIDLLVKRLDYMEQVRDAETIVREIESILTRVPDNLYLMRMLVQKEQAIQPVDQNRRVRIYKNITRLQPKNPENYWNYGLALQQLNRHKEAIPVFSMGIEIMPTYGSMYSLRAQSYAALKQYDLAIKDYEKAIALLGASTPGLKEGLQHAREARIAERASGSEHP